MWCRLDWGQVFAMYRDVWRAGVELLSKCGALTMYIK